MCCSTFLFPGVMNLVVTATGDPAITDKIVKLSHNVLNAGVSMVWFRVDKENSMFIQF